MTAVLVSGAGVAGQTLAFWLRRHGFTTTVVEQAPALRPGGQAVDVRGAALDVVDRMGLLAPLREMRTRMRGMSMLDADGTELMRTTEFAASSGRLDGPDVEVLREDLTALLHRHTRDTVEHLFDDSIIALREEDDGVHVDFRRADSRVFDLVVGADGLHSAVRRLAFGEEPAFVHHLGTYLAVFTMENILDLEDWQVWVQAGEAGAAIFPARGNTELRVNLGFRSDPVAYDRRDVDAQRRLLGTHFAGLGWEFPRLLEGAWKASDLYFDAMAQVRLDSWSRGRVTLLGDAGYCASPLSGQGTSLALVGAYVLAQELAAGGAAPLARYEARMRPFAEINQALATENPGGPASDESMERAKHAITLDTP